MAVPEAVQSAYDELTPALAVISEIVRDTILRWCEEQGYAFIGRLKQPESLAEKLESGRYKRLLDIDDWYACTIVLPTYEHEARALRFLRATFIEDAVRERNSTRKPPDVFRFDSTRFVGRLINQPGLARPAFADKCRFEVQLPTAFEHAWGVALHDLVYKGDDVKWERLRLASQLRASVEQIDMMIGNFDAATALVARVNDPETQLTTAIVAVFRELIDDGVLPRELAPGSWSRFADNVVRLIKSGLRGQDHITPTKQAVAAIDAALRAPTAPPAPRSGSLFQVVIGFIGSDNMPATSIDDYPLVKSSELSLFHGITTVPKKVEMLDDDVS